MLIHRRELGRGPSGKDGIKTSAKFEAMTVCSWQFAEEERLQSTAMTLITTEGPCGHGEHCRR
jgi:hypothetical protein